MKNFTTVLMIGFAFVLAACGTKETEHKGTVDIKEGGNLMPTADMAAHKAYDVAVGSNSGFYTVNYYQTENDTLAHHGGMYKGTDSTETFNKADYSWQKDTVSVRLYNTDNKKEHTLRLYGHGAKSGMMDDK